VRDVFRELVAKGIRTGVLRAGVQELGVLALMGMLREVCLADFDTPHPSPARERVAQLLSLFVEGAGAQ
jgi:hypothetical protein